MGDPYDNKILTTTNLNTAETYFVSASSAARYYNSDLSIWLSVDPLSDKYPNLSPYTYCANNPVRMVDEDGRDFSTHTDDDGNVIAVYDDGNLGIYKHSNEEIQQFYNGKDFANNIESMAGFTLCTESFQKGDKIDYGSYAAQEWLNTFDASFAHSFVNPLEAMFIYITNAGNGEAFDAKSHLQNGSQISDGVYITPRDLGNFAAGRLGFLVGLSKQRTLASFGAFQLSGNNKKKFLSSYFSYYSEALNTMGKGILPQQKTFGEAGISNYFQRLGYENIRTLKDFNLNFSKIWEQ